MYKSATNKDWITIVHMAESISHPVVREFVCGFLDTEVPDYFANAPASSSGKYHPAESNGAAGLCRHTIATAKIMAEISRPEYFRYTSFERDILFAAALLHDTFKQGNPGTGKTVRNHPELAEDAIRAYGNRRAEEATDPKEKVLYLNIAKTLAGLVRTHMGQWGHHKPHTKEQILVHLADLISSRDFISVSSADPTLESTT